MGNIYNHPKVDMNINNRIIEYTSKEKYLGHYLTDDNVLKNSILQDIEERATNVVIKFRNFINNNKTITLATRLKVFQACFRAAILSNCEAWGPCIPQRVHTLYHLGLKLAIGVRISTPTALIFLETRQHSMKAIIWKRQLDFWLNLNKDIVT